MHSYRKPTLEDIRKTEQLLDKDEKGRLTTESPVGQTLCRILEDIDPQCYGTIETMETDFCIISAEISENGKDKGTVLLGTRKNDSLEIQSEKIDIDAFPSQTKWDTICQIADRLRETTEEIENL